MPLPVRPQIELPCAGFETRRYLSTATAAWAENFTHRCRLPSRCQAFPLPQVDVIDGETGEFSETATGVPEQQDEGGVAAVPARPPTTRTQQPVQVSSTEHGDSFGLRLGTVEPFHRVVDVFLGGEPL